MCALETKGSIAKLNNGNYQNWKFKAEMVLIRDDLWDIVAEDVPTAPDVAWRKKNNQARASIVLMVEDSQLTHIRQCENARDIWITLRRVHERSNLCSKLFLLRKLYQRRLDKGQSMREHMNAMMETVDQVRALGEELKDCHVAALLLCSLPESYSTLITALEARPEAELTLEFVRGKLLEYDRRRENDNDSNDKESVLQIGQRNHKSTREPKTCYFCNKVGHIRKYCHALKAQRNTGHRAKVVVGTTSGNSDAIDYNQSRETTEENYCFGLKEKRGTHDWYVDSGATSHMTSDKNFFKEYREYENPVDIFLADGSIAKAHGKGDGTLRCEIPFNEYSNVTFKNVLFVPKLEGSLISVKALTSLGCVVDFGKDNCRVIYNDKVIAKATLDPVLYKINIAGDPSMANIAQTSSHNECIHLWHRRMGHRNPLTIERMHKEQLVSGMEILKCNQYSRCIGCIKGKTTNKPFPKAATTHATEPFKLVHSDICGPMKTQTHQGKRYFLTIIDDYSRYSQVYLLRNKNEAEQHIIEYIEKGKNIFKHRLHTIRTDGGGEFLGTGLSNYLKANGIGRQVTVPYSPQQNGVAERKNRSLVETARCMLLDAKLNDIFWGEAVVTGNYLQNRLIHRSCSKTPYQLWTNLVPDVSHIKVFGCEAHVYIPNQNRHKFESTTQEGTFLGYSEQSKGYRIMLKGSKRVIVSRTVEFLEQNHTSIIPLKEEERSEPKSDSENEQFILTPIDKNIDEITPGNVEKPETISTERRISPRYNKGIPAAKYGYKIIGTFQDPEDWSEVMNLPKPLRDKWTKAADEEMKAMNSNRTWDLVDLPNNRKSIGSRWVFKTKSSPDGTIYRARLVAKGYLQRPGEDFDAVFAPVVHYTTIRTLLAIAAKTNMKIRHLDAKSAFLQGNVDEELYMDQPTGYIQPGKEQLVCKLRKSIYGLRQSARIWNHRINDILTNLNFTRGEADNCLYTRNDNNSRIYILLYVDDLMLCADSEVSIEEIKRSLQDVINIKDLGPASSYLGIHITNTKTGDIIIDQQAKITNMLTKFGMLDAKEASTPMEPNFLKISNQNDTPLKDNIHYREIIGTLLYLSNTTRPDISTATGIMARRVETPTTSDLTGLKRIMRYLKRTINKGIIYTKNSSFDLVGYADADWAGDLKDRKSTSGHVFLLGGALTAWSSRKQSCVSLSSTEAEFVSAAFAGQELVWIKRLLHDFGYVIDKPITLFEDNQGCIALTISEKLNARTKHMDVKLQFIKELQNDGTVLLTYCPTESMLADIFTKPLAAPKFNEILMKLNMIDNVS